MSSAAATEFIEREQVAHPDLADRYQTLKDLHTRKLYHELTGELERFVKDPATRKSPDSLSRLYSEFIKTFQDKLNQVRVVIIGTAIAGSLAGAEPAQAFMEALGAQPSVRASHEAALLCAMEVARLQLARGAAFQPAVKRVLDAHRPVVEALVGADAVVHAAFYRVACAYFRAVGPAHQFYTNALLLLAYSPYDAMDASERFELAVDLSVAALTGEGVFNFGEVLATPILQALADTPKQWLAALIAALARGDIDAFNATVGAHQREFDAQPALAAAAAYVKEKVALLALVTLVFQRPAHARSIAFRDVAEATRLPAAQVEWLVMRALSCGLIRGAIDQVDEIVRVTWVQPRVLDNAQLQELVSRLDNWEKKVHATLLYVEEQTPELFQ